jgi:hypothetical protein
MKKKILSLLLAVMMVASLTACKSSQSDNSTTSNDQTKQTGETSGTSTGEGTGEAVTIKVFSNQTDRNSGQGLIEQTLFDNYMKENPNVTIEVEALDDEAYKTKFKAYASGNSMPDLVNAWGQPSFLDEVIDAGLLAELNKDDYNDYGFIEGSLDGFSKDGKLYGLPRNTDVMAFYYNKALFEQNGWEVPKTYADLVALADKIAAIGGILGGVAFMSPELNSQLDTVFTLAKERNLDLDFHADENGDRNSVCLQKIAEAAIRHKFKGKIICGHCCSLAVQSEEVVEKAIALIKQAKIGVVSLPMCNLYLQDRKPGTTPFWRGVTRVHELKQAGIPVAFASDNCRDPFYGFGDHDVLEVFNQSVRIAHLDAPYSDWISSVTTTPADLMGLSDLGKIEVGQPANLIIFKARYFSELLSRSQHNRIVLRNGKPIDTTLPDYAELDDLVLQ